MSNWPDSMSLDCGRKLDEIKPHIFKMEKEKTYFTLNVSQWNQIFFQVILGRFIWSIHHEIYTQYKG